MKIAILTLPLHTNYGGILQAYALQTVLERLGHDVVVLDKRRKPYEKIPISISIKRFLKKYILLEKIAPLQFKVDYKKKSKVNKYTWKFADKYIKRKEIQNFNDIKPDDFDCIIVGSDQVWRPRYFSTNYNRPMQDAFLSFTKGWNIKRITYAASFGTDNWEYSIDDTVECKSYINHFNAISVREDSGIPLITNYLKKDNVSITPDPTLLLSKDDYINIFKKANTPPSKGNLLVYFIDETEDKQNLIKEISSKKNLRPFYVNTQIESIYNKKKNQIQPPVEKWIRGFYDAQYIITDSYHACIFSIIFHKPFIVYGNHARGMARFESLLRIFKLEDRLIYRSKDLDLDSIISTLPDEILLDTTKSRGYNFLVNNLV